MPTRQLHHPLRVLVTGAGGPAGLGLIRQYQDARHEVYAVDMDPRAAGLHLVPDEQRALVPAGSHRHFGARLYALCEEWGIDVLVPTVDVELTAVARRRTNFSRIGTRCVLALDETLATSLDKVALAETCRSKVPVPRTEALLESFDLSRWQFPFVAKPRSGSGGRGVRIIRSPTDFRGIPLDGSYLVQEYLPGEEYSVDVFADQNGQVRATVPRVRLKVDSGVAVAAKTVHDPQIEKYARAVAHVLRLRFVANIQFKRSTSGVPTLLEVNPRFPGTMAITVASGVNMPALAIQAATGFTLWRDEYPFEEIAMVRYLDDLVVPATAFDASEREDEPLVRGAAS
ncbi:MAG: ATP-grasp domain-containing protein [Gemmatimonadota bacterium]